MRVAIGPTFEDLKANAEARVDLVFETVRQRRALYLPKVMDAERYLAGTKVPALEAEAKAVGRDPHKLATEILENAERDAQSEAVRVALKRRLREAKSPEALKAVLKPHGIGIYD